MMAIINVITSPAQTVYFETATPGNASEGWALEWGNGYGVIAWGVAEALTNIGWQAGAATLYQWTWDPVAAQSIWADFDNRSGATSVSMPYNANTPASTITMGGSQAQSNFYLDGEVMLLILGTGAPSSSDQVNIAKWAWEHYGVLTGTGYNAANHVLMPNVDYNGSAVTDAIELGAIYNPSGILGHKYWMASAPWDENGQSENPNLAFSDDGNTWSATGITNPLVPYPGGGSAGNNADPCLFDNTGRDSTMYLYYVRENATPASGVRYLTSTNGTTWTDQGFTLTGTNNYECPVVCYDTISSQYWLYTMRLAAGAEVIYRQSSSTPFGPWTAQAACSITIPGSRLPWHISAPIKIGSKWILAFSDTDTSRNLWLASSTDGLTWTCGTRPLDVPATPNGWDSGQLYRPSLQDARDGKNLLLWYTASVNTGFGGPVYLSQMVTVPQSVIP